MLNSEKRYVVDFLLVLQNIRIFEVGKICNYSD